MSKAEKRALEAYPIESHEMYDDLYRQRNAYVKGYQQAEKDLELTWEDIDNIYKLLCEEFIYQMQNGIRTQKEACQEVLKRFKAQKGE